MPFQPVFDPLAVNCDCGDESDHLTGTTQQTSVSPPPLAQGHSAQGSCV